MSELNALPMHESQIESLQRALAEAVKRAEKAERLLEDVTVIDTGARLVTHADIEAAEARAEEAERRLRDLRGGGDGTTHWEGCWRDHAVCAEARVSELRNVIKDTLSTLDGAGRHSNPKRYLAEVEKASEILRAVPQQEEAGEQK